MMRNGRLQPCNQSATQTKSADIIFQHRLQHQTLYRRILNSELVFPPGAESSYSDLSYILLAAVIEGVSGQSYQEFVRSASLHYFRQQSANCPTARMVMSPIGPLLA